MMMKKLFYFGMAAALLAGCSSADDDLLTTGASSEENNTEIDIAALTSDVPIEFATIGGEAYNTRGSIDDLTEPVEDVRVFCMARKVITDKQYGITWANTDTEAGILSLWQKDVKARIEPIDGYPLNGKLVWTDATEQHFYPIKEWFSYDFLAYHPAADFIEYNWGTQTRFNFEFDGQTDIFMGIAERPEDDLAYSASYFRTNAENAQKPYFKFRHLGAKLVFKFQLKNESAYNLYADRVVISNLPYKISCMIRRVDNAVTFVETELGVISDVQNRRDFELCERDGSSISNGGYLITDKEPTVVGDCIIIPQIKPTTAYRDLKLYTWLKAENGDTFTTGNAITVTAPENGWEMGKQYNITVKLTAPVLQDMFKSTILQWDSTTVEDIVAEEE